MLALSRQIVVNGLIQKNSSSARFHVIVYFIDVFDLPTDFNFDLSFILPLFSTSHFSRPPHSDSFIEKIEISEYTWGQTGSSKERTKVYLHKKYPVLRRF